VATGPQGSNRREGKGTNSSTFLLPKPSEGSEGGH